MAEYETCYEFVPLGGEENGSTERSKKRRKVSRSVANAQPSDAPPFVPLFGGREDPNLVDARFDLFKTAWGPLSDTLNNTINDAQIEIIEAIGSFVHTARSEESDDKIPTGLVVGGPNASSYAGLVEAIFHQIRKEQKATTISLTSTQAPNLKSTLKHINRHATSQDSDEIDNELQERSEREPRRLNYDLQVLCDHVQNNSIERVVIYFEDSECFQEALLTDLIDVLTSWIDRIPFVLLFNIATSTDIFEERLSHSSIKSLNSVQFELAHVDIDTLFQAATNFDSPQCLPLGSGLSSLVLQRHKDHLHASNDFLQTLKYLYMTYYFSDPLSLLTGDAGDLTLQTQHYEAIRVLPSFRINAEKLLDEGFYDTVERLLGDNDFLRDTIADHVKKDRSAFSGICDAIRTLRVVQSLFPNKTAATFSELYSKAMSGKLSDSTALREILLSVKKMPSDIMLIMLQILSNTHSQFTDLLRALEELVASRADEAAPLRSQYDVHHTTLRTTVVAHKVELSKQASALSKQDKEYSELVNRVDEALREYFNEHLINPKDLLLHELLIQDAKAPYRDVFAPKPRFAVERALSSPHDYLGCNCCESVENGLSPSQPATAVLYQLYLESGSLINTADLWSAFQTIMAAEGAEDEAEEQRRVLALFTSALAELKYLGMIKSSKKRADHLVKLSWKGL